MTFLVFFVKTNKELSYRGETALQNWLDLAKSEKLERGDNILRHYSSLFNHCEKLAREAIEFGEKKRKIRATVQGHSSSFNVIEDGINRKPVCEFLLVINTNRHLISYHFGVIAA